eukprot:TRINITY_DN685_c0_g2_i3.p1 TRINITY_DN685_c0_g2~~TRINITY_DN685_c0_g2_i3.p1  ORF type:complete len:523 (+),score=141.48 TRINITY_DN685_c0_g2_i3:41-1570(+)
MLSDQMRDIFMVDWEEWHADILFGDYLQADEDSRTYERIDDRMDKLTTMLDEYLDEYNQTHSTPMNLVFFKDAISHLTRVCRVIRQPRGNALLVGVGGSGRQSLTRLAASIEGFDIFSIEITRSYGLTEWKDDLKSLLMKAGAENKPMVFLFTDNQIVDESFLEDINNVLNAGEIPSLFESDEIEQIVSAVRPLCIKAGKIDTRDNVYQHFVQLVRENLHICLAFSPIGDGFRNRCRKFPAFVNCCTIDWFTEWPAEALHSVAQKFLKEQEANLGITEVQKALCETCVTIQLSVATATKTFYEEMRRHNYVTPTSYLELISLYIHMLQENRQVLSDKILKYTKGLEKLAEANKMVEELQEELTKLQPVLEKSSKDVAEMLVVLEKDQAEAAKVKKNCEKDAKSCQKVTAEVKVIKDDCQKDLDLALPAYESAIKALDTLKKEDITQVKSFANPPKMVQFCMEAVCILMGSPTTWKGAKQVLGKMSFLQDCRDYDKDNITEENNRRRLKK